MSLLDTIRAAVTPIAATMLREFGDELTVYAPARVRQADATTVAGWAPIAALTNIRGPLAALSAERAIRAWGADKDVVAEVSIAGAYAAGIRVEEWDGHGIRMTSGPEAGTSFIVVAARPELAADFVVLALQLSTEAIP